MQSRKLWAHCLLIGAAITLLSAQVAFGHIKIFPQQSTYGLRERYTMRVPNEKKVSAVRVEGEFPAGVNVYDFEYKPGWKIDFKKDDKGKIIGATWTGLVAPNEFIEFGMLALNPSEGASITWKFTEFYEDGSKEEYAGPADSKLPAPVVKLCPAEGCVKPSLTSSK